MKQRLKCSIKIVGDLPTFQPTIPQIEPEGKQDVETRFHDASSFLTASSTKTQPIPIPNREEKVITASPLSSPTEASPGNTPDFQKVRKLILHLTFSFLLNSMQPMLKGTNF